MAIRNPVKRIKLTQRFEPLKPEMAIFHRALQTVEIYMKEDDARQLLSHFGPFDDPLGIGSTAVVFENPRTNWGVIKFTSDPTDAQAFAKISLLASQGTVMRGAPLGPILYEYRYLTRQKQKRVCWIIEMERVEPLLKTRAFPVVRDLIADSFHTVLLGKLRAFVQKNRRKPTRRTIGQARWRFMHEINGPVSDPTSTAFRDITDRERKYIQSMNRVIEEQDRAGLLPLDLAVRNWGVRPSTGEAVMYDFGFSRKKPWGKSTRFLLRK